jgi:hypothetical protein
VITPTDVLADRLYELFSSDQGCEIDMPALEFPPEAGYLTNHETDVMVWSVVYGVAFGVARTEDPLEPNGKVAERALAAAVSAWARYGNIDPRDGLERIEVTVAPEFKAAVADALMSELVTFEVAPEGGGGLMQASYERAYVLRDEFTAIVDELSGLDFGEPRYGGPSMKPCEVTFRMRRDRVREIGEHLLRSGTDWEHAEPQNWPVDVDHAAGRALLDQLGEVA